jgi:two-component system cell cycle sensor histidine kinase/response regulator CckA
VEEPAKAKKPQARAGTVLTGSETVLLVADEQGLRTAVREFLRSAGYTVLEASNGMEALRMFESNEQRIDVLLTDYIMPGLSGPELAILAIKARPDLCIICMSGYADRITPVPDSYRTITFLQKPFGLSMLAQTVRQVLTDDQYDSASA